MMLVTTLFSASGLAGAGGVAAGTAAAAGGAAAGAGIGATALTVLQGVGTAFGALAAIRAGQARGAELEAQADEAAFQAREEYIAGQEETAKLSKELALTLSRQAAAFAAGGVDLGSVSVGEARRQAVQEAEAQLGSTRDLATSRSLQRRRERRLLQQQAGNARAGGVFDALAGLGNFAGDLAARV